MNEILDSLNPVQREAASCTEGPELIIAGAGSGKTRVLTSRVALLLAKGVPPYRILALTFTKKAAGEMRQRIEALQGEEAKRVCMGTFHSVFIRLMRPYAAVIGYPDNFTILDEDGQLSCIKDVIGDVVLHGEKPKRDDDSDGAKRLRYLEKKYRPKSMLSRISLLKNDGVTSSEYIKMDDCIDADETEGLGLFKDIFVEYERRCRRAGVMDYDDILVNMDRLLDTNPIDITERFEYILVDEYQDTNRIQYSILRKLTRTNDNICVVGDDSQSIYAFRGAKIQNIFNFQSDYPKAKVFKLEQNYRSTQTIVNAANALIAHNGSRIPKVCFSSGAEGDAIRLESLDNEREEARFVADSILASHRSGAPWSASAVLYRTNAQSRAIEDALIRKRIPYVIYSGTSFFDRTEVKDVLAYLKLAVNPNDDESFKRICNKPARGISAETLSVLTAEAAKSGMSLLDLCADSSVLDAVLKPKPAEKVREFVRLVDELWDIAMTNEAYRAVSLVAQKSGILDHYLADTSEEGRRRTDNIRELLDGVASFAEDYAEDNPDHEGGVYITEYLENVMLLSNADTGSDSSDCVSVMTAHCAKGLEFDNVYVTGLEQGLFPLLHEDGTIADLEEERRLFYVAVTRARTRLFLTLADRRMLYGKRQETTPSSFIDELMEEDEVF